MEAKIFVPQNARPRFYKPRPAAYSLKSKVEQELERQWTAKSRSNHTSIQFSDWTAPIVPVVKSDGNINFASVEITVSQ